MKNARKFLLKALVSKKRNICSNGFQTVCRGRFASVPQVFFKVLYTYTKFLSKLRKCCCEVMVDNCYKSGGQVALQVTTREIMTFW